MEKNKCPKCNSSRITQDRGDIYCEKCGYFFSRTKPPTIEVFSTFGSTEE
jgi:transcription initiation factor TFIIIB Brf1 subunit/transcription initiation factor TFIIB